MTFFKFLSHLQFYFLILDWNIYFIGLLWWLNNIHKAPNIVHKSLSKKCQKEELLICTFCIFSSIFLGFPCGSAGKESSCNAGDLGSIPGLGRSPREGKGYPLQYSGLKNSMKCIVHRVAKNWTRLSDFHYGIVLLHE